MAWRVAPLLVVLAVVDVLAGAANAGGGGLEEVGLQLLSPGDKLVYRVEVNASLGGVSGRLVANVSVEVIDVVSGPGGHGYRYVERVVLVESGGSPEPLLARGELVYDDKLLLSAVKALWGRGGVYEANATGFLGRLWFQGSPSSAHMFFDGYAVSGFRVSPEEYVLIVMDAGSGVVVYKEVVLRGFSAVVVLIEASVRGRSIEAAKPGEMRLVVEEGRRLLAQLETPGTPMPRPATITVTVTKRVTETVTAVKTVATTETVTQAYTETITVEKTVEKTVATTETVTVTETVTETVEANGGLGAIALAGGLLLVLGLVGGFIAGRRLGS